MDAMLINVEHLVIAVTDSSKLHEAAVLASKSGFKLVLQSTQKQPKEKKIDLNLPKLFVNR